MSDTSKSIIVEQQVVDCGDPSRRFTFVNDGAGSIFYVKRRSEIALTGTGAEITAMGAGELKPGQSVVVDGGAYLVACGSDTGATATMRVLDGSVSATLNYTLSGVTLNSDIDKLNGTTINVNSGNKDNGTMVVNQAADGVIGTALGAVGAAADVDGVIHGQLRYIGTQLEANTASLITAGGGGYVRQDSTATIAKESGGNLASIVSLLGKLYPTDSVANADSAAGNGSWVEVTLAANTIFAHVTTAGTCHFSASDTTPTGAIGEKVYANITTSLPTPNGKLWAYGIGGAHAINTTSYTRA